MKRTITFLMLLLMAGAAMAQGEFVCGDTVRDGNGNAYATVQIGALCWTTSNMRAVSYADGTPIAKAMIYNSERYNDTVANLANFGRLYTWFSAVNVPEGGDTKPEKDTAGFVQGVCPEGWHIPTVAEMQDLRSVPEEDLHSTDFWVLPNANTNSTGFSEVPGGKFSAELDRFEGLYTNSYMWTDSATSSEWVVACNSRYFCDKASEESIRKGDALSVRCVRVAEVCSEVATFNVDECDVADTSVLVKGNAKVEKGTFTEYGFVWGVSEDALTTTVSGSDVSAMTSDGDFEAAIKGLPACGDTVWYAAYAKTSQCKDLIYGDTMMFIVCGRGQDAKPCLFTPTVTDHEGNVYNTVQIGKQCWFKENIKVTTWTDGTAIPQTGYDYSGTNPFCYKDTVSGEVYYNWGAVFNNTLCPEGWHVPMDGEFDDLSEYLKTKPEYRCGDVLSNNGRNFTKALAIEDGWKYHDSLCTPGNTTNPNNATGFSAKPVGYFSFTFSDTVKDKGEEASFWAWAYSGYTYDVSYNSNRVYFWSSHEGPGHSVRCIKNPCDYEEGCPRVSTRDATDIGLDTAKLNGVLVNELGVREDVGFVWGYSRNNLDRTISKAAGDVVIMGGGGIKPWSIVRGITPCDTVYFAAFAKIASCDEYKYGDTLFFVAKPAPQDCGTVTDVDGNKYETVKLGNQCWFKTNLRTKHLNDSSDITQAVDYTADTSFYNTPYYYTPQSDDDVPGYNFDTFGLYYNFPVVTSGKACPEGWHVPTLDEFDTLLNYVSSRCDFICGGNYEYVSKALSSTFGWLIADSSNYDNDVSLECCPGYEQNTNNATGLSMIPMGKFSVHRNRAIEGFIECGHKALLWAAPPFPDGVYYASPTYYEAATIRTNFNRSQSLWVTAWPKASGVPIRCVKDVANGYCPTITTENATDISPDSAMLHGRVADIQGEVTDYGFMWGTSKAAVSSKVNGTAVSALEADGTFAAQLRSLTPCDSIFYVAFAKTSECDETVYGDTLMFITPAAAPDYTSCGTVIDIDDNRYTTVKIGGQCWMAENLRVTKYADGTPLTDRTANSTENIGFTTRAYFAPNGDTSNVAKYGLLYSWAAATNATNTTTSGTFQTWENYEGQGICPDGWHVPSDAEWTTLTNYVRDNLTGCLCDNTAVGKALASATDWKSGGAPADASWSQQLSYNSNWGECSIGWPSTTDLNNITGFNAYPAGNWNYESGKSGFFKFGEETMFWTSTLYGTTHATYGYNNALKRTMYYYRKDVESGNYYQLNTARSVRCLKDTAEQNSTSVNTVSVCNIGVGSALVSAAVLNDGNIVETERGVCYGVSQNPTVQDSIIVDDSTGIGEYSCVITGLTAGTKYYIRAYALNSTGVFYGEQMEYTALSTPNGDAQACLEAPTLTDYDGNVYNTVKIGAQCWMKENLRTTHFADGTAIKALDSFSDPEPWYSGGSDSVLGFAYNSVLGFAYNMAAIMNGDDSSNDNPSGVRGVCPIGWHVPSKSEWEQLFKYIGSQEVYNCSCGLPSNFEYYIAKALASNDESWVARDSFYLKECYPYLNTNANNSAGFSAVADRAIMYVPHGFSRTEAIFASSTKGSAEGVLWVASIDFSVDISDLLVSDGVSVRCVKDSDTCNVSDGSPCPNAATVTDYDGNVYNTVKIGEQCWMKENLRTKHFADGQEIEIASSDDDSRPTCWFPNGDENNVEAYGLLYNRIAAMNGISASYANPSGIQGVCPDGWHVPSYTEWYQLYNYVGSIPSALCSADTSKYIGKSLASKTGWLTVDEGVCNVGFNADGNNFTGFSAMPAGEQLSSASNFRYYSFGRESEIWSTTRELDYIGRGYYAGLVNNRPDDIMWRSIIGNQGLSVRCLKDDGCDCNTQTELPTVITSSHVSNINIVAADGGGFVSSQGSSSVTERGVCWSTSHNPTVTDNRTTDGNGAGRFTSYINYLTQGTTYYIRAYATNSSGTAYGREVEYTVPSVSSADGKPCPGTPTVTDHEGNEYNTVQIGTQCWTKENLRTTTSPSTGKYIVAKTGSILTTAGKMARWYNNDSVTYAPKNYGLLYNYNAAVDTFDVQFDETSTDTTIYKNIQFPKNSIRRGICPEGWHIPSVSEWGTLRGYTGYLLGNQENGYRCGIHDDGGAKALASTDDWLDYTDSDFPCAVGYHKEDNNSSGFSALPVGQCDDLSTGYNYIGTFRLIGEHTSFWYLIEKNVTVNHYWLANDRGGFYAGGGMRLNELHPVRCLKDN